MWTREQIDRTVKTVVNYIAGGLETSYLANRVIEGHGGRDGMRGMTLPQIRAAVEKVANAELDRINRKL
jgi:hypothetical protein